MNTAAVARFYTASLQFALVPIPPRCKAPTTKGWQRAAITDPETAAGYWGAHPDHNMGLLHSASATCAIDADGSHEHVAAAFAAVGLEWEALLRSHGAQLQGNPERPPKLLFAIPEGLDLERHQLRWPNPTFNPAAAVTDANPRKIGIVELRAGDTQDVLPPSAHPAGHTYRWLGRAPRSRAVLPPAPARLLELFENWGPAKAAMEEACPWADPAPRRERTPRSSEPYQGESIIAAFNSSVGVEEILGRNGYTHAHGKRWRRPGATGVAGVIVLENGRVYSHHAGDVLGDEHSHDAFGLLTELEHDGDAASAARAAAHELGLNTPEAPTRHEAPPPLRSRRYVAAAIERECQALAAGPGDAAQLERAAAALARFVVSGEARRDPLIRALTIAATDAGLSPEVTASTIDRAFRARGVAA